MDISKELQQFNLTNAAIEELSRRYMCLTVQDLGDKIGFDQVHTARMDIVKRRTSVTKVGLEMRAEANKYNKDVLAEEKRLLKLLEPIEYHLTIEENRITNEKERIKREAAEAEETRIRARVSRLSSMGMVRIDDDYKVLAFVLHHNLMVSAEDDQFDAYCEKVAAGVAADAAYRAELQRAEDAEKKRLLQVAEDQAAERKKLDGERAALDAEKKRIQDKIDADLAKEKRQAELRKVAEEAAAKALQDQKDRVEREAKEKDIREKKEAADKKRQEARRPDREKLLVWINLIQFTEVSALKTDEGKDAYSQCYGILQTAADNIKAVINEL